MFKIIKWHSLICTIILLFVIVTTRAGLDTEDPTEQARLNEVVALLDQQAEKWNYKRFNWAYLYPYLSQYIKCADFVNATQYDGYSCITALAEKLLRAEKLLSNSSIDTIQDAKMLIYSALNSLYFAHVEGRRKNMAELLKQVNTAMQPYQSYPILKPARQNQEAAVKTLVSYRDCFILNNDIAELRLADKFIDLIRNINFFVDITKPLKKNSLSSLEMTILPKVKEIMKYYSGCEETVFIFLVNASVKELEGRAHCPYLLQSEQRLILAISDAFRKLWSYLNLTCNREAVAKMAIVGFEFNPLSDMLFDASKPAESVDLPTLNVTDRQLQKAFEALTSLYACFVRDLPIDSLMDSLCSAGVITPEFKKTLYMYPAKCDKNNFLLNRVLLTLNKGCIKDFDKLLEAMEGSENSNAKDLAAKIREKLTEC